MTYCYVNPTKLKKLKQDSKRGVYNGWLWELMGSAIVIKYDQPYMKFYFRLRNLRSNETLYEFFLNRRHGMEYSHLKPMAETLIFNHR